MTPAPRYWFRAKTHGYGWGLPLTWEGWAATVAFLVVVIGGAFALPPGAGLAVTVIATVGLLAVNYAKGEPARWRWGKRRP